MENVDSKVTGYALIIAGILIMIYATFNVYQVFNGQVEPYSLFNFPNISISTEALMDQQLPRGVEAPMVDLLPGSVLSDSSNVIAHLFLMGFVVNLGAKIASIGTYLARPVVVKLKQNEEKKAI